MAIKELKYLLAINRCTELFWYGDTLCGLCPLGNNQTAYAKKTQEVEQFAGNVH